LSAGRSVSGCGCVGGGGAAVLNGVLTQSKDRYVIFHAETARSLISSANVFEEIVIGRKGGFHRVGAKANEIVHTRKQPLVNLPRLPILN
jgi:hypothetical protein